MCVTPPHTHATSAPVCVVKKGRREYTACVCVCSIILDTLR